MRSGADSGLAGTRPTAKRVAGFTLVEMLVVMGVIIILMVVSVPAYNALNRTADVTKTAYDLTGLLDQARAYAMASNTYVFVGLEEVDDSVPASTTPQTLATASAGGRIAVAVIASRDGTRGYDLNNASNSWTANYANGANFVAINKLVHLENFHLADFGATPPTTGKMARAAIPDPANGSSPNCRVGNSGCVSVTPFSWPLGSPDTAAGSQYYFTKVINIDPQGVARIQGAANADSIPQWMEIDLQPTHGNAVPAPPANQSAGDQVALQIDAMTGSVRIYRP